VNPIRHASFRSRSLSVLALAAIALGPLVATSAEEPVNLRPQLSEKVGEKVAKLQVMLPEAEKTKLWAPVVNEALSAQAISAPGSYDEYYMCRVLAMVYLNRGEKGDYGLALPLLAKMVGMPFLDKIKDADLVFTVAQLYLAEENAAKAEEYARRYLEYVPKPPAERIVFLCSILLQRAEKEGQKADPVLIKEVLKLADFGLRLTIKPDERLLLIKAVGYMAIDKAEEASEVLELLVHRYPTNRQYWLQLFGQYANTNRDLRGALTIERAQALGMMNTARENIALPNIYYNLGDYERCIELLEKGLTDGTIDPEPRNFETLAYAYIQTHRQLKAVDVYVRAHERFPTGKYAALVAQMYYSMDKKPEALEWAKKAIAKGELERPGQMVMFTAFLAYELGDLDTAFKLLQDALPLLKNDRERNDHENLKRAVEGALAERKRRQDEAAEQAEQAKKKP
jgi:tetratricopeptide (TPR) repeat protein